MIRPYYAAGPTVRRTADKAFVCFVGLGRDTIAARIAEALNAGGGDALAGLFDGEKRRRNEARKKNKEQQS